MARRGIKRTWLYRKPRKRAPRRRPRSNPGNPGRGSTAARKAAEATINTAVIAGSAVALGAIEARDIDLPHIEFLGQAGTYGIAAWGLGHAIDNAWLKYGGAMWGGIELYKRSTKWFATDEKKKIIEAIEKAETAARAALEKVKKAAAMKSAGGWPENAIDDNEVAENGETVVEETA